jgi:uncharacterized protein YndB with AHSA1/START domain
MSKTRITTEPGVPQVLITREFAAPRELVFRAHMDPELLVRWLGPRRLSMVIERYELRDGGTYRFVNRDPGGAEYGFHGVFHGTPTPDVAVRTFEFEGAPGHVSLETMALTEHDGRTTLRTIAVYQSVEDRDAMVESGMETGVQEGYAKLDELLTRLQKAGRGPYAVTRTSSR